MGTRSATLTRDAKGNELCRHYRHYDGYPEGHGAELARELIAIEGETDPMRWLTEYMQAMEDLGCEREDPSAVHGDLEWLYLVTIPTEGQPRVTVWQIDFGQAYEDAMKGEPEADGTPRRFLAQIMDEPMPDEPENDDGVEDEDEADGDASVPVIVELVLDGPTMASITMTRRQARENLDRLDIARGGSRQNAMFEMQNETGDFIRVVPSKVIAASVRAQDR